jgi:penicillin amidase
MAILVALMLVIAISVLWLRGSLPQTSGMIALHGLQGDVTVARDHFGIPTITAKSKSDALFALGFVHAQDRLWQMELQRRAGQGRLAEVLGASALPIDKFTRTLGIYRLAEAGESAFDTDTKSALDAYVAGINAFLATRDSTLPPEFVALRYKPDPWRVADVLVWGRLEALQLSYNWRDELLRARVAETVPPDMVADLWPDYPASQPVTIGLSSRMMDRMLAAIPGPILPRLASNEWVISGSRTLSGKPLLANDPHLDFQAPILWYLVSISAPGLEVTGASVPGVPLVLLGHNQRIAWGMTTTTSDTEDLFVEKAEGDGYATPTGPQPFETRTETVKVRGQPDVPLTIRATRHGPVISDLIGAEAENKILALSASALQPGDRTAQAIMKVERAANWQDFTDAMKDFGAPQQNVSYADIDGHIGLVIPGLVPIRKSGDGTVPHPGWTGEYDWTGWVPFDALPKTFDPPSGVIANANNKPISPSYSYFLAASWPEGYRAQRILDLLGNRTGLTPADMSAMQMDELSLMALDLKPLLLRTKAGNERARVAHEMLADWDGTTRAEDPRPLIFEAWLGQVQKDLLAPWLGPAANQFRSVKPLFVKSVLTGKGAWCGPPHQNPPASCDDLVAKALDEALDGLDRRYGGDMTKWRWGTAHVAEFDALLFGHVPVLDRLTRLETPTGGDGFTLQRGAFDTSDPTDFRHGHGAGLRAVYDLSDLDSSRFIIATGESGNPLSGHWRDLFGRWRANAPLILDPSRVRPDVLTLVAKP